MSAADYSVEAKTIIAKAIENAIKHVAFTIEAEGVCEDEDKKTPEYWPLGSQADEQTCLLAIETFIKVTIYSMISLYCVWYPIIASLQDWRRGSEWKYFIKCLGQTEDKLYFEVRWSIPTRRKPIPRATASVYFTLWIRNQVDCPTNGTNISS